MSRPRPASERAHSRLSPSGAGRFVPCPGSVALCEQFPPPPEKEGWNAADEGTAAHKLLELCLTHKTKKAPTQWVGEVLEAYEVTDEMAAAVEVACDYIRALKPATMEVEVLVRIPILDTPGNPGQGHIDVVLIVGDTLYIIDYKHGRGVPVEVVGNEQLRLYTIGYLGDKKPKGIKKIVNTIIQPRCPHPDGPVREDKLTKPELDKFSLRVIKAVRSICDGTGDLNPGEKQCRWCDAKARCPALAKQVIEVAQMDFGEFLSPTEPSKPSVTPLTPAQLGYAMDHIDLLKIWIKAVEEAVFQLLDEGKEVPGYKLVLGKSMRKWASEEDAMKWFKENGYHLDAYAPRSLVGIGAAEKMLEPFMREKVMKLLTIKPEGKPTVAVASDPRQPIKGSSAQEDFADILNTEPTQA